jgi:hypothetical protein
MRSAWQAGNVPLCRFVTRASNRPNVFYGVQENIERRIFVQGECKPNLFEFAEPPPKITRSVILENSGLSSRKM